MMVQENEMVSEKEFRQKFRQLQGLLRIRKDYSRLNDTDDILSEARIGLWRAYKTYKPGKGAQFDTYAVRCMNNRIYNATNWKSGNRFRG